MVEALNLIASKFRKKDDDISNEELISSIMNRYDKKLKIKTNPNIEENDDDFNIKRAISHNFKQILADRKTHEEFAQEILQKYPELKFYNTLEELEKDYDLTDYYKLRQMYISRDQNHSLNEETLKRAETMLLNYILPAKNKEKNKKAVGIAYPTLRANDFYGKVEFFFSSEIVNILWGIKDIDFIHSESYDNERLAHLILHYIDNNNYSELKFSPYSDYTYKISIRRGSRSQTITKNPISNERARGIINSLLYQGKLSPDSQEKEQRGVIVKELDNGKVRNFRLTTMGVQTPNTSNLRLSVRKLTSEAELGSFSELNYNEKIEIVFKKVLANAKNGLILIGGATDSGKSTLLYLLVKFCADILDRDVVMGEAPIEVHIKNASQVDMLATKNANEKIRQDFKSFLKGLLSQAPDIAVLSEVRDEEEIQSAVKLPQRGTFCMTTAHGNDNKEMSKRFISEGDISEDDFKDVITGMVHQELIPKLCPECKGEGCAECENTGLDSVRLPLCEIIMFHNIGKDDDIFDYKKLKEEKKAVYITKEEMLQEYIELGYINKDMYVKNSTDNIYEFLGLNDE